ncbi:hypothetical protein ACWDA3_56995 [Nonomuraea rubra]
MDPITTLVAAFIAASSDVVKDAVVDGYQALKGMLLQRFGQKEPKLEERINEFEKAPDTWEKPLAQTLGAVGATQDAEVLAAAERLLKKAEQTDSQVTINSIERANVITGGTFKGPVTQNYHEK